jgi:arylsulfatase A-like enzyme
VPLIIRGPGVPRNVTTDAVTTHTDLAPTILRLTGAPLQADFDGEAIPLTQSALAEAGSTRHEHVNVEYWGFALGEGKDWGGGRFPLRLKRTRNSFLTVLQNDSIIITRTRDYAFYPIRTISTTQCGVVASMSSMT